MRILHGSTGYEPRFVGVVFAKCVKRKERKIPFEDQEVASSIPVLIVNAKKTILGFVAALGHYMTQRSTKNSQC